MRMPRPRIEDCCVHVTHRCHKREFLFQHDVDRIVYRDRLFEASRRFPCVRLLNYVITSNHIHLLAYVPRMSDLSDFMHWLQGTTAGDLNFRQKREGAFWRGRFHATLVESGRHLARCLFYVDMNMVRVKVVSHPGEWMFGGARELLGLRQRYRIIDRNWLMKCLNFEDSDEFDRWYREGLTDRCAKPELLKRESHWTSAFAVGSRPWLEGVIGDDPEAEKGISPLNPKEDTPSYVLRVTQSVYRRLMKRWLKA